MLSYAFTEILTLRRLTRFWLLAGMLTLISQVGYLLACWYLSYHLPYDPTAGINAPKYLLGSIDPTILLFFQWASLLLLFDAAHRHERNRINEVLYTKPCSNLEVFVGRTIAVAGIIWAVVVLNIVIMQLIGSFSIFGWNFAESLQWHSVINLILIDVPTNLIFWTSFLVLLGVILRTRVLVVLVGGSAMFGWYWLVIRAPYSLLSLFSPSSNDTLFVSELLPKFMSVNVAYVRISYVLFAIFFLATAALLQSRNDGMHSRKSNLAFLPVSFVIGICIFLLGARGVLDPIQETKQWKTVHAEYPWDDDLDIQRISGSVTIDPDKSLDIDLVISLVRNSGESTQPLVFTLNPGLKLQTIKVDGSTNEHSFDNGLLEIQTGNEVVIGTPFELTISAQGIPDPRFAYLDSAVDYVTDRDVPVRTAQLLGKDGSIFSSNYVALMPGSYWYPIPGPINTTYARTMNGRDFFEIDFEVTLKPKRWSLVASTAFTELPTTSNVYAVKSNIGVPEVGLFASLFERATIEVGGFDFTMFLHEKHIGNLRPIKNWNDAMRAEAESMIADYQEYGLSIPLSDITFVEIPRRLRTVGGGWRMDAVDTLPGLVLLKEHGYPRAKLQLALDRYLNSPDSFDTLPLDENSKSIAPLTVLAAYFKRGTGTDAPWTSLHKHLWTHHTSPSGEYAPILDQVVNWFHAYLPPYANRQFSIYSTMHISNQTMLQFNSAEDGLQSAVSRGRHVLQEWFEAVVVRVERTFFERPSNWAHIRKNGFVQPPSAHGPQQELESLLIRSQEIAIALLAANQRKTLFSWFDDLRTQYYGKNFSYTDLIDSAKQHEIEFEPFLTEWVTNRELPAYVVHEPMIRHIANDEQGNARFQTTFVFENTSPVAGYVRFLTPFEVVNDFDYWNFQSVDSTKINGNEKLRINLLTNHSINRFGIDPYLSINRDTLYIDLDQIDEEPSHNIQPSPFIEATDYLNDDKRIVVDDLDDGFQVHQQLPNPANTPQFGPVAWFGIPRAGLELDGDIPIRPRFGRNRQLPNVWQRWNFGIEVAPFGRYRRSTAYIQASISTREEIPKAEFITQLTLDGNWKLEYFNPWLPGTTWGTWGIPEDDTVSLAIAQGDQRYEAPLNLRQMPYGWKDVGTYNLNSEKVSVEIVFRPKSTVEWARIFADAIRWTPMNNR